MTRILRYHQKQMQNLIEHTQEKYYIHISAKLMIQWQVLKPTGHY